MQLAEADAILMVYPCDTDSPHHSRPDITTIAGDRRQVYLDITVVYTIIASGLTNTVSTRCRCLYKEMLLKQRQIHNTISAGEELIHMAF